MSLGLPIVKGLFWGRGRGEGGVSSLGGGGGVSSTPAACDVVYYYFGPTHLCTALVTCLPMV